MNLSDKLTINDFRLFENYEKITTEELRNEKYFFVLYDLKDNLISYYENLDDVCFNLHIRPKDVTRKFKKGLRNFINLYKYKKLYHLYCFNCVVLEHIEL